MTVSAHALDELRAFVTVVDAGSFAAAARARRQHGVADGVSFSRRVDDLEARLGVPLLERTSRAVRLTPEGEAYYEHAVRALSAVADAEAIVRGASSPPRGVLRVTTAAVTASLVLDQIVPRFLADHAGVRVEVDINEERVDLVKSGFDLAVWTGRLASTALLAKRLGVVEAAYFASPAYMRQRVEPKSAEGLVAHDTISIAHGPTPLEWPLVVDGVRDRYPLRPRLVVADVQAAVRAAALGLGIVRAPTSVAAPYVARGELQIVMPSLTPPSALEAFAVFPSRGWLTPRVRAFVGLLLEAFAPPAAVTDDGAG